MVALEKNLDVSLGTRLEVGMGCQTKVEKSGNSTWGFLPGVPCAKTKLSGLESGFLCGGTIRGLAAASQGLPLRGRSGLWRGPGLLLHHTRGDRIVSSRIVRGLKPQPGIETPPNPKSRWCVRGHQDPDVAHLRVYPPTSPENWVSPPL